MGSFCRIAGELTCAKCRDKATLKKNAKEPAELATCRGCKKPVKDGRKEVLSWCAQMDAILCAWFRMLSIYALWSVEMCRDSYFKLLRNFSMMNLDGPVRW